MQRRKWDTKTKVQVVIQGLKGRTVAEICGEYQISQNQYYQWRDQFLSNALAAALVRYGGERVIPLKEGNKKGNKAAG